MWLWRHLIPEGSTILFQVSSLVIDLQDSSAKKLMGYVVIMSVPMAIFLIMLIPQLSSSPDLLPVDSTSNSSAKKLTGYVVIMSVPRAIFLVALSLAATTWGSKRAEMRHKPSPYRSSQQSTASHPSLCRPGWPCSRRCYQELL
ncbi:hypothetical protein NL676_019663 [Syzygium grande]|nr:hypothetical protein NL676_019663 [Syzygium grande]